jgi:hypothetical protein
MAKTTINPEKVVGKITGDLAEKIARIHNDNLQEVKQTRKSTLGGDFSRYPVTFDTSQLKPQTRAYGSIKGGMIGYINGFKSKDESWRMLNVLAHDRYLHQRYSRHLVKANYDYKSNANKIRRQIRGLL